MELSNWTEASKSKTAHFFGCTFSLTAYRLPQNGALFYLHPPSEMLPPGLQLGPRSDHRRVDTRQEMPVKPGPTTVIACPHCGAAARQSTIMSGNTFGMEVWTDGKRIAPMLPESPPVVQCHKCQKCFWLTSAPVLGEINWGPADYMMDWEIEIDELGGISPFGPADRQGDVPAEWVEAPFIEEPDEAGYRSAVAHGLAKSPDEELQLRILGWQRHNDRFRDPEQPTDAHAVPEDPLLRSDLHAIKRLLNPKDENHLILMAEVCRELGVFETAVKFLGRVRSRELQGVAEQMRKMCADRDTQVKLLAHDHGLDHAVLAD